MSAPYFTTMSDQQTQNVDNFLSSAVSSDNCSANNNNNNNNNNKKVGRGDNYFI